MVAHRYSATPHAIETPPAWVQSGEIAIPEIQRPFVRDATKGPQSSEFPPSGVSGELPVGSLARSVGAKQGRLQVVKETYPHRWRGTGGRTDGHPAWAKGRGLARGRYNRIANFVLAQSEIDIVIGSSPPERDFAELAEQCNGGIADLARMRDDLRRSYVPGSPLNGAVPDYDEFPEQRRVRVAQKVQTYFGVL